MRYLKLYDLESGEGGGDPPKKVDAPKGYTPLTILQRKSWNNFLDYLQEQGVGGSIQLDKRDQTLGLDYLKKYNKENPDKAIDPGLIDDIQYEQYMLRKGDSFPTMKPEELSYVRKELKPAYLDRPISDVDAWLGSRTSREYYPTFHLGTNKEGSYDWGTDFESFVKSASDPAVKEKYKVKQ